MNHHLCDLSSPSEGRAGGPKAEKERGLDFRRAGRTYRGCQVLRRNVGLHPDKVEKMGEKIKKPPCFKSAWKVINVWPVL